MNFRSINEDLWVRKREIVLTLFGLVLGITFLSFFLAEQLPSVMLQVKEEEWGRLVATIVFNLLVLSLFYGSLLYKLTRLGYIFRRKQYLRSASSHEHDVEALMDDANRPLVTVLVPSYKEELDIIKMTLLSAAFQTNVDRRITLLIDDPPDPSNAKDLADLVAARNLPGQLMQLLDAPRESMENHQAIFLQNLSKNNSIDLVEEWSLVRALWQEVAHWFEEYQYGYAANDPHTALFKDHILQRHVERARKFVKECEGEISHASALGKVQPHHPVIRTLRQHYTTLVSTFSVDISSFERKRYCNFSHEPNKAMNLNTYIGLLGKSLVEEQSKAGISLKPTDEKNATLTLAKPDYIITLDADSLILPQYTDKLVSLMEAEAHTKTAVIQTPYSAFPDAQGSLERVAGITTDIQYIIHQGFTGFGATYWVGANALIRMKSLEDIVQTSMEDGNEINHYIHDRTVIEDTESSIDLVEKGWGLHNHPERLAYSATPPDYGSFLIQRRRWANGGLIILPKLMRYLARWPWSPKKFVEGFFRIHYLASIAFVNVALLILLATPFASLIDTVWLPLTCLPYFFLYCRDIQLCGYRATDFFKVYALNLLLIPINLGGVLKSIQQGITGMKIPFGRTPKVQLRTAADPIYIYSTYMLVLILIGWLANTSLGFYEAYIILGDINVEIMTHGLFALFNASFLLYACITFIGLKESWEDTRIPSLMSGKVKEDQLHPVESGEVVYIKPEAQTVSSLTKEYEKEVPQLS